MVTLRVARMWDFFRPRQNIQLNGLLEGPRRVAVTARHHRVLPAARAARCWAWFCCAAAGYPCCRSSRSH